MSQNIMTLDAKIAFSLNDGRVRTKDALRYVIKELFILNSVEEYKHKYKLKDFNPVITDHIKWYKNWYKARHKESPEKWIYNVWILLAREYKSGAHAAIPAMMVRAMLKAQGSDKQIVPICESVVNVRAMFARLCILHGVITSGKSPRLSSILANMWATKVIGTSECKSYEQLLNDNLSTLSDVMPKSSKLEPNELFNDCVDTINKYHNKFRQVVFSYVNKSLRTDCADLNYNGEDISGVVCKFYCGYGSDYGPRSTYIERLDKYIADCLCEEDPPTKKLAIKL